MGYYYLLNKMWDNILKELLRIEDERFCLMIKEIIEKSKIKE